MSSLARSRDRRPTDESCARTVGTSTAPDVVDARMCRRRPQSQRRTAPQNAQKRACPPHGRNSPPLVADPPPPEPPPRDPPEELLEAFDVVVAAGDDELPPPPLPRDSKPNSRSGALPLDDEEV